MGWRIGLGVLLVCGVSSAYSAQSELATRQEQARQQQAELRRQIEVLQKNIERSTRSRRDATQQLRQSEQAISDVDRRLDQLQQRQLAVQANMRELNQQIKAQDAERQRQQQALADQLGAQYRAGSTPWAALLSGDDPNVISRDLYFLSYVSRQQTEQVLALRAALERLSALRGQAQKNEQELKTLEKETHEQRAELAKQQQERSAVLARISAQLTQHQEQSGRLQENDKRLGDLIGGLEVEIARQAELARRAEEQRRREAAQRAEQERLARLEQQRQAQQAAAARESARKAREQQLLELARRQPAPIPSAPPPGSEQPATSGPLDPPRPGAGAAIRPPAQYTPPSRDERLAQQDLRGSGSLTVEETNLPSPTHAQVAQARAPEPVPAPQASAPKFEPDGGFTGLERGLPRPVQGPTQGKFGAQRPEGGAWRGVVLRAQTGEAVRAVAQGRVVFANWLSGFGNLVIVDHGREFLTVYAYNQSVLKQVGDIVGQGDVLARVGSTGGQVEPGLYFEIRHKGNPVNPELWLAR